MLAVARFIAILTIGLLAGASLANYLLESSLIESAAFNVEYKQLVIRAYTVALPALAVAGLLAALLVIYLGRRERRTLYPTLAAVVILVTGLATTLAIHFPINAEIVTWSSGAPPADWRQLLERWQAANTVRTVTAIVGFILLLLPDLIRAVRRQAQRPQAVELSNARVVGAADIP